MELKIWEPGCEVRLGTIPALISQVAIHPFGCITYQVIWWSGNDRKEAWVEAFEITGPSKEISIGFHR